MTFWLLVQPCSATQSYSRSLVGAKATKLGSCDKHPAYCYGLKVDRWHTNIIIPVIWARRINFKLT